MKPPKYAWNDEFTYNEEELQMIEDINSFLSRPLSPRWIYYGLFDVPDAKQQKFLNDILGKARKDKRQLINRDLVTDDTRNPTIWAEEKNLWVFLDELHYMRDYWQNQPIYHEVWMEDQASLEAIKQSPKSIIQKYRMNARYCKGFNSIGAMWQSYKGKENVFQGFKNMKKPIRILYYGDLNPSGWAIPVIIVRQFKEMGLDIDLKRMALNPDQLEKYNIPVLTKISGDPRRKEFNKIFGYEDWENQPKQSYVDEKTGKTKWGKKHLNIDLEKMDIEIFEDLLDADIQNNIDMDIHKESRKIEQRERDRLEELLEEMRELNDDYEQEE